jgi:D-lactate dehydrogenase
MRCAGYNNVDLKAVHGRLAVYRVPAYSPHAVAEHAVAMLLTIVRRTHKAYIRTRDFNFSLNGMVGFDLHGKTMGVVGTGRIGKALIGICRGFGMRVIACDARKDDSLGVEYVPLEQLLAQSDVISLHCPLTAENTGLINRDTIAKMKDGVILINTARGGLINEVDLREALLSGKVAAAAVDVVSTEPIREDNPLLGLENCLITPHIAWASKEARQRLMDVAVENVAAFLKGEPINNVAK